MSTVTNDYGINTSTAYQREQASKAAANSGSVDQQSFLKLLTTQLCNQDPLNPMEDIDFTGQLAQLQALEEQMAMTKTMKAMRTDSQMQAGTAMIGKYISGTDVNGATANGMVTRLVQNDDGVFVELSNKQKVPVTDINNVWDDATGMYNDIASSGNVIGMWVDAGYDSSNQPVKGIVEKVVVEDGQVMLKLYGGQKVSWDQVRELRVPSDDELWYTLPDEVREKVETAQKMVNKGVTGKDETGKAVNGIVAGAELDGSTVYLVLYSGERVDIDSIVDGARKPTASDAYNSLKGYWVTGLDEDGSDLGGIVVGADSDNAGMYMTLDNGKKVYFDTIHEIRNVADVDEDDLVGMYVEGLSTGGEKTSGLIVSKTKVGEEVAIELDNGKIVLCSNITTIRNANADPEEQQDQSAA